MVVNNDGTQTYAGGDQSVTGLALDETVVWHGTTLPLGGAAQPPLGALFLLQQMTERTQWVFMKIPTQE